MKTAFALLIACSLQLEAQLVSDTFQNVNLAVPDTGQVVCDSESTVGSPNGTISGISVWIDLKGTGAGAWDGDYYLTLVHGNGFAVLLNRVGRAPGSLEGYSDSGFAHVTFQDDAANGDVHVYRVTLEGNQATPILGTLSGTWAPDGRNVSPDSVLSSTARTALLSSFLGSDASGPWTLSISDCSTGGTATLSSWGLQITVVPEPAAGPLAIALVLLTVACWRASGLSMRRMD
jgi:hypothetical protein